MKNFLDLLDTDLELDIVVNGEHTAAGLQDFLVFDSGTEVSVDGIEVLPRYQHLVENGMLTIAEPFYQWYHRVSGQGWLLKPQ